jgi:hypothetical protein
MSEHFLGSNKAFEILAYLGLDPLLARTRTHEKGQLMDPRTHRPAKTGFWHNVHGEGGGPWGEFNYILCRQPKGSNGSLDLLEGARH